MNDDQHGWTYELYDVVFCKETQEEKTVHAPKKAVLCTNIAQNWAVKTEQLIQYYNTKFSPVTEVKTLKRYSTFPEKKWKILTSKLWRTLET